MFKFDTPDSYRQWREQQLRKEAVFRFLVCLGAVLLGIVILFSWRF